MIFFKLYFILEVGPGCKVGYKYCVLNRFKKDKKEAKDRKQVIKERLTKGINIIDGSVYNMAAYDKCIDDVAYDLAGYVVHSR